MATQIDVSIAKNIISMLNQQQNAMPPGMSINPHGVLEALTDELATIKNVEGAAATSEPEFDAKKLIGKNIIYADPMMVLKRGTIKQISPKGIVLIEEHYKQNKETVTMEAWYEPNSFTIKDVLDDE